MIDGGASRLKNRLQPGDLISARVVEYLGDGRYRILVAGIELVFKGNRHLQLNEKLVLRVVRVHPFVQLEKLGSIQSTNSGSLVI